MANKNCFDVEEARSRIEDKRYIIEEFIGEGGMACVYRAKESGTPNVYALKLLKEQFRQRDEFLEVFQIEATNMRDLQHPNIVRFYKFIVEEKSAYILMENIDGNPLTKYIQRARATEVDFPIDEIVRIMAQIARAISHLHNEGFIHRDVKPGNVLLGRLDGRAYLTDLGIAGSQGEGFVLAGAGTPSYMPYEQQESGLIIDRTVDIYAFAIMLFEMFAGQKPFRAPSGIAYEEARRILIGLHQSAPVPDITENRPELPEELNAIFTKALAKNPADRYRNVMDFAQAVHQTLLPMLPEDVRDFENIEAHPIEDLKTKQEEEARAKAIEQRNRSFIVGGLTLGVVVILLVIAGVILNSQAVVTSTQIAVSITTDAPTATLTLVDTSTNTALPSDTPAVTEPAAAVGENTEVIVTATEPATGEPTATDIAAASTPEPTVEPTHTSEPTMTPTPLPTVELASGAAALGLPSDTATLNELVAYALREQLTLIPLRLPVESNSFRIQVEFSDIGDITQYGIAFRMQNERNYLLLYVDTVVQMWRVEAQEWVQTQGAEGNTILENTADSSGLPSGELNNDLPLTLSVTGLDDVYQVQVGSEQATFTLDDWSTGSAGLWLLLGTSSDTVSFPEIDNLTIDLLGADVETVQSPVPQLNPEHLLIEDVRQLAGIVDLTQNISCTDYMQSYEHLQQHQQDLRIVFNLNELADSITPIIEGGRFIYNRCTNLGADSQIDPNSVVDSVLDLDDAVQVFLSANATPTP